MRPNHLTEEQIAAKKAINQRIAQRFLNAPTVSADQFRLTCERYPELEHAYNGEFGGDIDWAKIEIVSPEKIRRFAGIDVEAAQNAARAARQRIDRSTAAVVETNRSVVNSQRGTAVDSNSDRYRGVGEARREPDTKYSPYDYTNQTEKR